MSEGREIAVTDNYIKMSPSVEIDDHLSFIIQGRCHRLNT